MTDDMLVDLIESPSVSSSELRDILQSLKGALITNDAGVALHMELERRMPLEAFISAATQAQPGL